VTFKEDFIRLWKVILVLLGIGYCLIVVPSSLRSDDGTPFLLVILFGVFSILFMWGLGKVFVWVVSVFNGEDKNIGSIFGGKEKKKDDTDD